MTNPNIPPEIADAPFVPGSAPHVKLWDAINMVVSASGGRTDCRNISRQVAVVAVETALRDLLPATPAPAPVRISPEVRETILRALRVALHESQIGDCEAVDAAVFVEALP